MYKVGRIDYARDLTWRTFPKLCALVKELHNADNCEGDCGWDMRVIVNGVKYHYRIVQRAR